MKINILKALSYLIMLFLLLQLSACGEGTPAAGSNVANTSNGAPEFVNFRNVTVTGQSLEVIILSGMDPDGDQLTFAIVGGADASLFELNPNTGLLRFKSLPSQTAPTDADQNNIYNLLLSVSDGQSTIEREIIITFPTSTTTSASPVFTSSNSFTATEGSTAVGTVAATDTDSTTLRYNISSGADAARLSINSISGVLTFRAAPNSAEPNDADKNNIYSIEVSVTDGINTTKQNINITLPSSPTSTTNLTPSIISGSSITASDNSIAISTIVATDPESDALSFSIIGGADAALLNINQQSGALSFINPPNATIPADADQNNVFNVEISVSDGNSSTSKLFEVSLITLQFDSVSYTQANAQRGGLLYDKWWAVKIMPVPTDNNPIWDEVKAQLPNNTNGDNGGQWRCKECHGWDYKGVNGAYNQTSSHYTGIRGLNSPSTNFDAKYIFDKISVGMVFYGSKTNLAHSFMTADKLDVNDVYDLTKFVLEKARTDTSNPLLGDVSRGEAVFNQMPNTAGVSCNSAACHSTTSTQAPTLSEIVDVANSNPQEFLHKVRFGSPASDMPAGMSVTQAQDVYAFVAAGAGSGNAPNSNFDPAIYATKGPTDAVQGGKMYDKWWAVASNVIEPTTPHTRWPASNTAITGSSTWRCKECHGWDYRGADGVYATGKHATGFGGIVSTANFVMQYDTAPALYAFLKEDITHGFDTLFTDDDYYALTKFVMSMRDESSAGLSAVDFIDDNTKLATNGADPIRGKQLYEDVRVSCGSSICHGSDGKNIDFKDGDINTLPNVFVHDIAQENPWELMHKIRFGHPGFLPMPSLYDARDTTIATINVSADILAYSQSDLAPDIKRAGQLYDKWWNVSGIQDATVPVTRNQTWVSYAGTADPALVSDASTWRCKECHGWDYQGVHGKYGYADLTDPTTGKHYSGIRGYYPILNTTSKDKAYIFGVIKNGTGNTQLADHNFGRFLSDTDINLLADFITNETEGVPKVVAMYDNYLNNGDATVGKTIYESTSPGNCASSSCHGTTGTAISTVDVSAVANGNPQEFIHKVRYGHPGSLMTPSSSGFVGLNLQAASDVLAYAKTLVAGPNPNPTYSYATADIVRGGRLYDKWWKEMQAADETVLAPTDYNPQWLEYKTPDDFPVDYSETKKIESSWRCKTCHGWDYKGINIRGDNSDNLLDKVALRKIAYGGSVTDLQNHIFNWIKNGLTFTNHVFSEVIADRLPSPLGDRELWDLTKFLLEDGIIDSDSQLVSGIVIGANAVNGSGLFNGSVNANVNCAFCHGIDGITPPPISQGGSGDPLDIFQISSANDNPWEFLHKVRFGQPGSNMPGTFGQTPLTDSDAFDILGYSQLRFNAR